ncbi:MAG TPA: sulfatase/phosphatase domain-containing protein, partial [Actinomycetota bacterium]|nr:sulfatase/phosphatase domain-containing protein [Actinomycetota bacterium]
ADLPSWRPPSYNEADVLDKPDWLHAIPLLTAEESNALDAFRIAQTRTLLAVDDAVAEIMTALVRAGRLANTFIVFTSDNGFLWGEHRLKGKRAPYDEAIRVPFVVRYDPLVARARSDPRLVLNVDIAPTVAALAGAAAPGAEGRSIEPLLHGADVLWRTGFLVENRGRPRTYCALRRADDSFVTYATGERELYDAAGDAYQLTNLAGDPARSSTAAALRRRLARLCNPPPPGLSRELLCTREGTPSADVLRGTARYDVLCGRRGKDHLYPRGGEDWVYAGRRNDLVDSRDGHADVIRCGPGKDVVRADRRDRLRADCERILLP